MSGNTSGCSTFARGSGINVSRYRGPIIELLVAALLSCGVRRHDDALICGTRHAVSLASQSRHLRDAVASLTESELDVLS